MAKSTPSEDPSDTRTHLKFFKRFKHLNPLAPSLSSLGFILVTVLFVSCFFYLDSRSVARGIRSRGEAWLGVHGFSSLSSSSSSLSFSSPCENARPRFLDEGGDGCDLFDGKWVWDETYPLYESQNCSFMDQGFRCSENGRPDAFYTKWRWQPKACNLPRFLYIFLTSVPLDFLLASIWILGKKKLKKFKFGFYVFSSFQKSLVHFGFGKN